mmetsp:Transcript_17323/g.25433  ORF Transcript_17323/g.25433 Transcript_17323/m.25433 type:complete len:235 (+) Transcript_17323:158-862(+)
MKVLSSAFFVLFLQVSVEAFTFVSNSALSRSVTTTTGGPSSRTVQRKHHLGDDVDHDFLPEEEAGSKRNSIHENNPINVVLALGLALTLTHAPFFQPSPAFAAADQNVGGSGAAYSTLVLSAIDSIKDADIVDFSMPSYESAARAEVNSNLKGDKYLLGEASKNYESSSSSSSSSSSTSPSSSSSSSPETAAASVVDEKADKAAAKAAQKAAQKAARAQQQAAVEEAAKAAAAQ